MNCICIRVVSSSKRSSSRNRRELNYRRTARQLFSLPKSNRAWEEPDTVRRRRRQLVFARYYVGPPRALPALVVVVVVAAVVGLKSLRAMARRFARRPSPAFLLPFALFLSSCLAQNPATNTPVPPLQWIELTSLLTGSVPPPMKYASIGYDSTSGTVLVFGGESNGFPTQQTYLCVYG